MKISNKLETNMQRFEKLQLRYQDEQGRIKQRTFSGFTAQVIQHELDHCEGILI